MLPTMAEHGCPPEHHTTDIVPDGTHIEKCARCGYTLTHSPEPNGRTSVPSLRVGSDVHRD
jgi:hypothetical protein